MPDPITREALSNPVGMRHDYLIKTKPNALLYVTRSAATGIGQDGRSRLSLPFLCEIVIYGIMVALGIYIGLSKGKIA